MKFTRTMLTNHRLAPKLDSYRISSFVTGFAALMLLSLSALSSFAFGDTLSMTFSGGDIESFHESPADPSTIAPCADSMSFVIPEGMWITGVDVEYDMISQGGSWMSEQRSRIWSSTYDTGEMVYAAGTTNAGGTVSHQRSLTEFNGLTGNITFLMDAKRVFGTNPAGCNLQYAYVVNNTWTLHVFIDSIPSCIDPVNPSITELGATSAVFSWISPSIDNSWEAVVQAAGTGEPIAAGTPVMETSFEAENLDPTTQYEFWVREDCGADGFSNWIGPLTFTTLCLPLEEGTYTVGGSSADFDNFTELAEILNCGGVAGNVVINVTPGSGPFFEQITFEEFPGSGPNAVVTINGNGNTLQYLATNTNERATLKMIGTSYVIIDSLHILSLGSVSGEFGFTVHLLDNTNHVTFNNCIIEANTTATGTLYAAFASSTSNTSAVTNGLSVSNLTVTNCEIIGGYYGLVVNGPTGAPWSQNNYIANNVIRDFHLYGLYIRGQENSVFYGNEITRPNRVQTGTFYGIYLNSGMAGTDVYNNIVHNNLGLAASSTSAAYPIYSTGTFGTSSSPANIYNNLIYNINNSGTQYGIYFLGTATQHVNVYHNSVSLAHTGATGTSAIRGFFFSVNAGPIDLKNNIFHINNGNTGVNTGIYISNANAEVYSDHNVISLASPGGTNNIGFYGSAIQSMEDWQDAGFDSNSVAIDPDFIDETSNLEPQTGVVATLGTDLNDVAPFDFFGVQRPNTPSAGAIQFEPPACASPGGLSADVTDVSATVSWFENSPSVAFNYEYGPEGFVQGSGTAGVTVETFTELEGLSSQTSYDFYIQSICAMGVNSDWAGPFTFSTLCDLISGTVTLGTPSSDFLNFTELIDYFECGGINGHLTVIVEPNSGPFEEQIYFTPISGASDSSTVTIQGNGNVIDFSPSVSADRPTVRFDGASYITLEDLHIQSSSNTTYGWVVHIANEASHITIDNCTIENNITETGTGFAGIVVTNSNTLATSAGFTGHNITITNNEVIGGHYGLAFNGPSSGEGSADNLIENNLVIDYNSFGLYVRALTNSSINANEMTRPNRTNTASFYGVYALGGDWSGTDISNNQIHNSRGMAASSTSLAYPMYFNAVVGDELAPVNIYNNTVFNINNSGIQYGIYVLGANTAYLNFYHNTISLANTEATGSSAIRAYFQSIAGSGPVQLVNNIFHVANGNSGTKYCIYFTNSGADFYSNNNVLSMVSTEGTTGIGYFGTGYETFEDWLGTGMDSLSTTENPIFQDEQLMVIPQNGAIKEIGADLTAIVPLDITGEIRPENPDPGAYQFQPPTCLFVSDMNADLISDTYAWISWVDNSEAGSWNIEFGPEGFTQGSGTTVVSDSTAFMITGLTTQNTYDVYIQTNCGPGDLSDWAGPLTFTTLCPPFPAGTYTLGGTDPDYTTFTDFFEDLYCGGIAGPVVLNVETDSIYEQVEVFNIPLTNETNTVTVNGNGNVLNFAPSVSADRYTLRFTGSSHVIIEDLHIMSSGTGTFGWVVHLKDMAQHITLHNCVIQNNIDQSGTGFAGIVASSSDITATTIGPAASHLTITNNSIIGGYYGIALNAASSGEGSLNNTITNNIVHDYHVFGIRLRGTQQSVIADNDISRPNRTNTGSFYGIYSVGGNMTGTEIYNNRIHNSLGQAASSTSLAYPFYFSGVFATEEDPLYVYNNLVYNINNSGTQYGIYVLGAATEHLHFYHNSISLANTEATGTSNIRGFWQSVAGSGPVVLKNNIFHIENGNSGSKHCIYITSTAAQVTSNNNVLSMQSISGNTNIGYFGTDFETLEDWQGAGFDSLSVDFDPVFINAQTNLYPQNENIKAIGEDLTAIVPVDIFGEIRSTTPDPGAIEFEPADCLAPSGFEFTSITANSAVFDWDNNSPGTAWEIEYGPAGFEPTGVATITITEQPFTISELDAQTSYDVYIRVDCGTEFSEWGGPGTFTTACEAYVLPFFEGFDGVSVPCWTFPDGQSNWQFGNSWPPPSSQTGVPHAFFNWSPSVSNYSFSMLSPIFDATEATNDILLDYVLFLNGFSTAGSPNFMVVEYKTLSADNWITIDSINYQDYGNVDTEFNKTDEVLTGMSGQMFQIRFRVFGESSSSLNGWAIDDVYVRELSLCPQVSDIVVSDITSTTALVAWTENGSATSWDIEYGPTGFEPTGIPTVTGVTNPYMISGLDELTSYDVYVRADCGALGTSPWTEPYWVDPVTFTTQAVCPQVANIEVDSITPFSAVVSWTEQGTATLWDIEYDTAGFTPTGIPTVSGVTNPYSITGLDENTSYDVYIRADCVADGTSVWVGPVEFTTDCVPPDISVLGDTICSGESTMLFAFSSDAEANFNWYDAPEGGNLISQSDTLVTPELTSTTTYYVEASSGAGSFNVGPLDPTIGAASSFTSLSAQSMIFEVYQTMTIEQVTMFPSGTGLIDLEVRTDDNDVTIFNQVYSVTGDGNSPVVVNVNLTLEPGEYWIGGNTSTSTTGLIRNSSGAVYPYEIPGLMAITGNTFSPGYYYYYYNWLISAGCTGDRVPVTAVVEPAPDVDLGSDMTICESDSLILEGPEGYDDYLWTITTASGIDFSLDQSILVEETGTYALAVTSAFGCMASDTVDISVSALPEFEVSATNTSLCIGDSVTLTATGTDLVFSWSHDVENGVTFAPDETATYTVTATNADGCTAEQQITITVNEYPDVTAGASATEVCSGNMVTLTGSGADSYEWSHGVTDGEPFVITETTTFTVVGTSNGCSSEAEITITVNPLPEVSLTLAVDTVCIENGPVTLTGGSPEGGEWSGPGVTDNTFDPTDLDPGTYTIIYTYTDANGCSAEAQGEIVVELCVNIRDITLTDVVVYPNPFEQFVDITWNQLPGSDAEFRVIDLMGRTLSLTQLDDQQAAAGTYRLELSSLPAGSYFLEIRSGEAVFRTTLVRIQ